MEKEQSFQQILLEQLDIHMQKNECRHGPYTCTKINSKWIINLSIKCKTVKFIEVNIWENIHDFEFGDELFDITPKAWSMKENNGF